MVDVIRSMTRLHGIKVVGGTRGTISNDNRRGNVSSFGPEYAQLTERTSVFHLVDPGLGVEEIVGPSGV